MFERVHLLFGNLMWLWGVFEQFLIISACSAHLQILICRPPRTSRLLIIISSSNSAQVVTYKFLNFAKPQTYIFEDEILNMHTYKYIRTRPSKSLDKNASAPNSTRLLLVQLCELRDVSVARFLHASNNIIWRPPPLGK